MKRLNFYMLFFCLSFIGFSLQCSEREMVANPEQNNVKSSGYSFANDSLKVEEIKESDASKQGSSSALVASFIPQSVVAFFKSIGESAQDVASLFARMTFKAINAMRTYLAEIRNSLNGPVVDNVTGALDKLKDDKSSPNLSVQQLNNDVTAVVFAMASSGLPASDVKGLIDIADSAAQSTPIAPAGGTDLGGNEGASIQMPVASEILFIKPNTNYSVVLRNKVIAQMNSGNDISQTPKYTNSDYQAVQSGKLTMDSANLDIATYNYTDENGRTIKHSVDTNTGKVLSSSRVDQPVPDVGSSSLGEGKKLQQLSAGSVGDENNSLNEGLLAHTEFDQNGKPVSAVKTSYFQEGSESQFYDSSGRLNRIETYDLDRKIVASRDFEYDVNGELIKSIDSVYNKAGIKKTDVINDSEHYVEVNITYNKNGKDKLSESINGADGKLIRKITYNADGTINKVVDNIGKSLNVSQAELKNIQKEIAVSLIRKSFSETGVEGKNLSQTKVEYFTKLIGENLNLPQRKIDIIISAISQLPDNIFSKSVDKVVAIILDKNYDVNSAGNTSKSAGN